MDEAIGRLVESIESIAPHVWAVIVRQAQIDAWLSLFWLAVCIGAVIVYVFGLRWALRKFRESDESFMYWDGQIPLILISSLIIIALLILVPTTLTSAIRGFANPEYVAIMKLLGLVQ
jgi:hypothetical protein